MITFPWLCADDKIGWLSWMTPKGWPHIYDGKLSNWHHYALSIVIILHYIMHLSSSITFLLWLCFKTLWLCFKTNKNWRWHLVRWLDFWCSYRLFVFSSGTNNKGVSNMIRTRPSFIDFHLSIYKLNLWDKLLRHSLKMLKRLNLSLQDGG